MAKMMTFFAFSCLCHHRGVSGYAGTPSFPAVEAHIPHSASRTACPASLRDHLSLFADNVGDFYSQSEDNQDLSPDTEI